MLDTGVKNNERFLLKFCKIRGNSAGKIARWQFFLKKTREDPILNQCVLKIFSGILYKIFKF